MSDARQVERVARAIYTARFAGSSKGAWARIEDERTKDKYRRMARAAIEAAKE
jgi:hypothetical protein